MVFSTGSHVLFLPQDIAKKIIRMNEIKARRERAPIQSVNDVTDAKSNRSKRKETTGRRRLPVRIQLRREASLQSSERPENKKPKLSIVVKGLEFLEYICYKFLKEEFRTAYRLRQCCVEELILNCRLD